MVRQAGSPISMNISRTRPRPIPPTIGMTSFLVFVLPPKNLAELLETAAKLTKDLGGPYGIGVRGSRSWASIHPGFLSGYSNFGEKDFNVADGKLKAAMNTAGSKAFHTDWVKMIQDSGPKNWSTYT